MKLKQKIQYLVLGVRKLDKTFSVCYTIKVS